MYGICNHHYKIDKDGNDYVVPKKIYRSRAKVITCKCGYIVVIGQT